MKEIEVNINSLLISAVERGVFPSYASGLYLHKDNFNKEYLIVSGSKKYKEIKHQDIKNTYYDLASLTKPFSTALSLMVLVGEGKISLSGKVSEYLPVVFPGEKREITISQLLNHSSGLPAHQPYYLQLEKIPAATRKDELVRLISNEKLAAQPGTTAIYSDLGYLLLGLIIEKLAGVGLEQFFEDKIVGPLGLAEGIFFKPPGRPQKARESFMPTEECRWRGKVLQGEVSDENCWVLGGVAGHAGLFGNIESVLGLTSAILEIWQGCLVHPHIRREELACFLEARSQVDGSCWALGFDRPTPGGSSSGRYLSPRSVGHLGFTGTSFWIDPDKGLVVVLLTNRVHPSRENVLIREFRPLFHDRVVEILTENLKLKIISA